jgi:hypothetical protein
MRSARRFGFWPRHTVFLAAAVLAAAALFTPAPAAAQNEVHGPVQKPVPMTINDAGEARRRAQTGEAANATNAKDDASQNGADGQSVYKSKFPNRDTAKNRRDYEMGTDAGADTITLGRDAESGDTVMTHKPKKQEQQQNPFEGQPIQVKPIVPMPYGHR